MKSFPLQYKIILILTVVLVSGFVFFGWSAFGDTILNLTLQRDSLDKGMVAHYTFDAEDIDYSGLGWGLATTSYDGVTYTSTELTNGQGLAFRSDGSKMYLVGKSNVVYQYSLLTPWDVSSASYDSVSYNASESAEANDLAFKTDGTELYIAEKDGDVHQYNLATAWDLSGTVTFDSTTDLTELSTEGVSIEFKPDGTKMYGLDGSGTMYQYSLSPAWDSSTASYDSKSFDGSTQESNAEGSSFSEDGTKMFLMGRGGTNSVYQYTLSTPWDVSTASYNSVSFDFSGQFSTEPNEVEFGNDGTKMYLLNKENKVPQYSLSTGMDAVQDRSGNANHGDHYASTTGNIKERVISGAISQGLEFDGVDDYVDLGNKTDFEPSNITISTWVKPEVQDNSFARILDKSNAGGLTTGYRILRTNDGWTVAWWDGSTNVNLTTDGLFTNEWFHLTFTHDGTTGKLYVNGELATSSVSSFSNVANSHSLWIGSAEEASTQNFKGVLDDFRMYDRTLSAKEVERLYGLGGTTKINTTITNKETDGGLVGHWTFDGNNIDYSGLGWDISTTSDDLVSKDVSSQETTLKHVAFSEDGSKMYITGHVNDTVYQYSLTEAWNVSTASYDSVLKDVGADEGAPNHIHFKPDGTKMYITGQVGEEVNEYTLSTPWNVSSASLAGTKSVSTEDTIPVAGALSTDGTKLFMLGWSTELVHQYTLSTAWDITSASYDSVTFDITGQEIDPQTVVFKSDGTRMYIVGENSDTVYQYDLSTPWDLSSVSYNSVSYYVGGKDSVPSVQFSTDGTKMYIAGQSGDDVHQFSLGAAAGAVQDRSSNANHGDHYASTTGNIKKRITSGAIGQGLEFDGVDDYVVVPYFSGLDDHTMSVGAWVKLDNPETNDRILDYFSGNNYGWDISTGLSNANKIKFRVGGTNQSETSNGTVSTGEWNHVFVTYSQGSVEIYLNGQLDVSGSVADFDDTNGALDLWLMANQQGGGESEGAIDDVRIYDYVLSAKEVERLYNLGATTKINTTITNKETDDGLVAHWTFDGLDVSGPTVTDRSEQGNNGSWEATSTETFTTAGTDTFVVPAGVTEITVKTWGAGGGGGGGGSSGVGGDGGGGGFAQATISVTSGETLDVRVGGAGSAGNARSGSGDGGGGGGRSAVERSGSSLVVAGAGGGAGGGDNSSATAGGAGGAGGGSTAGSGGDSSLSTGGGGGSQSAGGSAGSGDELATAGSSGTGGIGPDGNGEGGNCDEDTSRGNGASGGVNGGGNGGLGDEGGGTGCSGGGGGGGGYFGGGGGGNSVGADAGGSGGGGGSNFVSGSNTTNTQASGSSVANSGDSDYVSGHGNGGGGGSLNSNGAAGQDGLVVVKYKKANTTVGKIGQALEFDGVNDCVDTGSRQGPQNAATFAMWVKPNGVAGADVVLGQWTPTDAYMQFIVNDTGDVTGRIHQTDGSDLIGRTASGVLVDGEWQHIAYTWDGGTSNSAIKVYRNGIRLDDSNSSAGTFTGPNTSSIPVRIGAQGSGSCGNPFSGTVDDVRIYDRALSVQEVKRLYQMGR